MQNTILFFYIYISKNCLNIYNICLIELQHTARAFAPTMFSYS